MHYYQLFTWVFGGQTDEVIKDLQGNICLTEWLHHQYTFQDELI